MNDEASPWGKESEDEYLRYLAHERHMFAWCWVHYGGVSPERAREAAHSFYVYEDSSDPYRGLEFHDEAWKWALSRIFGEQYWVGRPELEHPSEEYRLESERLESTSGTQLFNQADR
jgi:hypothetical protein